MFRADLSGAALSRANLSGANLSGADLSGANLSLANLSLADLFRADLSGANLSGADLSGANLSGANLSGADLSKPTRPWPTCPWPTCSGPTCPGANLSGADLSGANLSGANLSGADLSGADLSGADLSLADLSRAKGCNPYRVTPLLVLLDQPGPIRAYKLVTAASVGPFNGGITRDRRGVLRLRGQHRHHAPVWGRHQSRTLDWCMREWREGYRILVAEFLPATSPRFPWRRMANSVSANVASLERRISWRSGCGEPPHAGLPSGSGWRRPLTRPSRRRWRRGHVAWCRSGARAQIAESARVAWEHGQRGAQRRQATCRCR